MTDVRRTLPTMRFRQEGRFMRPFWAQLVVEVHDALGTEETAIRMNEAGDDTYRLDWRSRTHRFDDLEALFSTCLDRGTRLTWSLDVDVIQDGAARPRRLRVDGRKDLPKHVAEGHPRPSFFIRVAITMDTQTFMSRWHNDWNHGFEDALEELSGTLGSSHVIRACFFCRWSAYEPSSSTGHLGCLREYDPAGTVPLYAARVWVDELNECAEFGPVVNEISG